MTLRSRFHTWSFYLQGHPKTSRESNRYRYKYEFGSCPSSKIFPETRATITAVNTRVFLPTEYSYATDLGSSPTLAEMTSCPNTTIRKTGASERTQYTWGVSPTHREPSTYWIRTKGTIRTLDSRIVSRRSFLYYL